MVLPNGEWIHASGKDIMEKLDNWHKANSAQTVSSHFVGATETQTSAGFPWTRAVETEEDDSQPAVTEREIEELSILENLVTTTQRKIENTKK